MIGNGNVLVGYDSSYAVRDLYYPQVGRFNHTAGSLCRTGFWLDGRFAWVSDAGWERDYGYEEDTLVTKVTLRNQALGLTVRFQDYVDMARNYFIRNLELTPDAPVASARVFFHYDWYIDETDIGCTVLYDPVHRAVIAYKGKRYFLLGGQAGVQHGISSWATGKKGGPAQGTWVDAQDGVLGRNPIDQGSVDCTVEFDLTGLSPQQAGRVTHWVTMGERLSEITTYGQDLIVERGEANYRTRTITYWDVWSEKDHRHIEEELGHDVRHLYRRSVLTARTHVDNRGGVVAATDFDITKFARDTYSYVWPRDGALVANALDRSGHEDTTRRFFEFCRRALVAEGYFLHKYTPEGDVGSSWHPWFDAASGRRVLPIQEDETGLVVWALWEHFRAHKNLDFVVDLYSTLVVPAAQWMATYVDPRSGLPQPSWDLWEERWGVHAFTVGAVWGGLRAAADFAELFGDADNLAVFRAAAARIKEGADAHLYRPELNRFARRLSLRDEGGVDVDQTLDSAIYGLWRFGMYEADEPRIAATMQAIAQGLGNQLATGGQSRYENDYYFQVERDTSRCQGNPWFICTLWLAQWYTAIAKEEEDLAPARAIIDWAVKHQLPGGLLSEQVDPNTGAPLSVSPLTWSHAEFVVTVDDYVKKAQQCRRLRGQTKELSRKAVLKAAGA